MWNKRGQAAMEFLMTYGWALLVVLIAIGALAYLGVLNPTRFVPDKCDISPGFTCVLYKVDSDGNALGTAGEFVLIRLQNGLGSSITQEYGPDNIASNGDESAMMILSDVTVGGTTVCTTALTNEFTPANLPWTDGSTQDFIFGCGATAGDWAAGDKLKATIEIRYNAGGLDHFKQGQLVASVEE